MATAPQPIPALIDLLFQNATQHALPIGQVAATAKQNAEPQDTVTMANTDPAAAQQAAQAFGEVQVQFQEVALVVQEPLVPLLNPNAANNAAPTANADTVANNAPANPANTGAAPPATAANTANGATAANTLIASAANTGANATNNTAQTAQQQELAQLDQVLQQLGIPASSIPVVQQLAMLLYRFDPQAQQDTRIPPGVQPEPQGEASLCCIVTTLPGFSFTLFL